MEEIKKYKVVWIAILFSLIIEIFVCNYGFFRTLIVGNRQEEVEYSKTEKVNQIRIDSIDQRVTSINICYQKPLSRCMTYQVTIVTEDKHEPTILKKKVILPKDSQSIQLDTHSKCKSIEILIEGESATIQKIQLNQPIFHLNSLRVILMFLGVLIFLKIKDGSLLQKEYDANSKKQKWADILILAVICISLAGYVTVQVKPHKLILSPKEMETTVSQNHVDCISLQTEAFVNGQIELMVEPTKELKELSNPYDISLRQEKKVNYLYDTAYYQGKYYNYFGVAPILTSILPFRLLTGSYLPLYLFNMLYVSISIFALYALYRKLVHRYIHKVSRFNFLLGFFVIFLASSILILIRGMKYDIAVSSGIAFLLLALNLAISVQEKTKLRWLKLILLGLSTGLVVLSKPTFIIYYALIIFFFWNSTKELATKEKCRSIGMVMGPLVILAIFQMLLNVLRFGSILEFGAKYQLTVDDMRISMNITVGKILEGFAFYIGKMPDISPLRFPFLTLDTQRDWMAMNERCYQLPLIGLAYIPIFYVYLFAKEILKNSKEKELKYFIILCLILAVIAIIMTTCCGGIMEMYSVDFKLFLAIGAVLLMLKAIEQKENRKWINKVFHLIGFTTIMIMLPIGLFAHLQDWGKQSITVFLENTFEFWK